MVLVSLNMCSRPLFSLFLPYSNRNKFLIAYFKLFFKNNKKVLCCNTELPLKPSIMGYSRNCFGLGSNPEQDELLSLFPE